MRRQYRYCGARARRAKDGHTVAAAFVVHRGGQIQRDILHRAVDGQRHGVHAVVLAAHHDVDPVVADGLDGRVVADKAVLRVDVGGKVLIVDKHLAVGHHLETDVKQRHAGLHIRRVRA